MLIQPDYSFLMDLLISEGIGKSDIRIDQIIHLDNTNAQKNYNLNCLKKILPLYGSMSKYEAFYYYDNVYGRNGDFTLFPYVLITSEYACLLTANITKGYMTCRPDSLEMFRNIFDDYLKKSSLLLKRIDNLYMQLDYVEGLFPTSLPAYSFQMTPCLTVFMTGQLTEKYVLPDMPYRSSFIEKFTNYVNNINKYRTNDSMISIFSMAGLLRFMDTGEIREYPPDTYKRPDLSDRIYFVRQILRMCQKHNYKMLKENIGDLDNEIFMYISRTRGYLMLSSPITHSLIYLDIEEPGLLFTFFDFCDNMDEQLFFSKEEMIEQLQMIIEKYQHKLSFS